MKKLRDEMGRPPQGKDNYNATATRAAKKAGAVVAMDAFTRAVMDADPDFRTLHQLVNNPKLVEDDDLRMLRRVVNDAHHKRLHAALDKMLEGVKRSRRTGDSKFLRKFGIRP